jgi:hypothetical protein
MLGLGREPLAGRAAQPAQLAPCQRVDRIEVVRARCLDLDEDDRATVADDKVELTRRRPMVAGEQLEAEAFVMLQREALAGATEDLVCCLADCWTVGAARGRTVRECNKNASRLLGPRRPTSRDAPGCFPVMRARTCP